MKALLWKEGREILPKVLICLVLCLMIHLMRLRESFAFSFLDSINGWIMAVGLGSATILGVETIASERKSGALAFLKSRPSVVWQVVLAKFGVGSVGLLVVVVPMIGLLSFAEPGQARMEQESTTNISRRVVTGMFGYQDNLEEFKITVRDVGYGGLMLTTFLLCWMWYGLSLLASSLVDSAGKAIVATVVCVVSCWLVSMLANAVFMRIGLPLNLELPPLPFDQFGHSVRFIRDLEYQLRGLAFCATTLGIALVLTKSQIARFDVPRSLWLGVGLGCGMIVLFGAIYGGLYEWVFVGKKRPVALIELGTGGTDMVLDGSKGFIVGRNDMRVVDLNDPSKPQLNAGKVSFPQWNMIQATAANGKVYISGTKTIETVKEKGFVIVGFNAQGEPVLEKEYSLPVADAKEQACWIGRPVVVGHYLYIGVLQRPNYVQVLLTVDLRGDEPVVINRLVLGPIRSTEFFWHEPPGYRHRGPPNADLWDLNKQYDPALLTLHLQGRYGYLVTANGVYVADFQDPAKPENVHHIPIKDWHEFDLSNFGRPSVLDGERLYVRRYWPREMVIYELAQPGKPVEVGTSRAMHLIRNIAHADGYHYVSRQRRVEVLDAASYSAEERWILNLVTRFLGQGMDIWRQPTDIFTGFSVANWRFLNR